MPTFKYNAFTDDFDDVTAHAEVQTGTPSPVKTGLVWLDTDAATPTYFDDIVFEMFPTRLGALTKPDWDSTNKGFLFPQNDAGEYIDIIVQLPHRYKEGTTIFPHLHVVQAANQQAVFKLDYKWYNIGAGIPASATTYTMNTYAIPFTANPIHQIVKGSGIDGTGKTLSSLLQLKLYRDDNAYTGDMLVKQFDVHIEMDAPGSRLEYTK